MNNRNKWLAGSASALALLAGSLTTLEGYSAKTYDDVAGVATACIGHTGDVVTGKTYTKEECSNFLKSDMKEYSEAVIRCTNVPLSEKTYVALVIFTFNVGSSGYCSSSLVKKLNSGDYAGACEGLLAWNKIHEQGKLVESTGLTNRRKYERKMCLEGLDHV